MKEIKLISLDIENFKCFRHLKLDFNGRNAEISGDNAVGKTSVFDAFMWVLFNKSSTGCGDKNFEVKPLDSDGNVIDHNALTSVEVVLEVNGEKLTLLRTYREKWETRRGSSEAVYTGNTSEYYVDGVPVKSNAFKYNVSELVSEDTFRLLTNTTYFASDISWQERRAVLFQVAGVKDDREILATNAQFAPLVESLGKLSLEDYKKKLLAEKRKFDGAKTEVPARISECQKTIDDIQGLDFAGAKAQVEALQLSANLVSEQIVALEHDSAADQKRMEIREAQLELSRLDMENERYRDSQSAGNVNVHSLNIRLTSLQTQLNCKKKAIENESAYISSLDQQIADSRKRWMSINGESFTGGTCLSCGQKLPAEKLQQAMAAFEASKQSRQKEIEQTANANKAAKAQAEDRFTTGMGEVTQLEAEIAEIRGQIAAAEASKVEPKDMEDYADIAHSIRTKIQTLNGELAAMTAKSGEVIQKLRDEKAEIQKAIQEQQAILGKESLLEYSRQRVEQLREDAKNAAAALEAIEKMLWLIDVYVHYKAQFVEESINRFFRIARFRLFREQANGGIEDRCDVVYDGIAYENLNNGMKINLGIDIINTLSMAYGVRVPLFVDNAESVTKLETCGSQIIRLHVKNYKELRVNYES